MRQAILLLAAALPLCAEFLQLEVAFDGIGCASCVESLEGRLRRVRGVERVEVDAGLSVVTLHLAPKNRVRLEPLLSRMTQDGTKIVRTMAVVRGTIETGQRGMRFQPSGLTQVYRLELNEQTSKTNLQPGVTYEVRGVISKSEPDAEQVLEAESIIAPP